MPGGTPIYIFFSVAPRKNAIQCTLWLYLRQRAGILLSWFF
ncbi:hypothetical protein HMPREF3212_02702 [Citrobacter freundii]|nr:hypothetical protein HMPREF3212_02702 [Citrobacter freundii]